MAGNSVGAKLKCVAEQDAAAKAAFEATSRNVEKTQRIELSSESEGEDDWGNLGNKPIGPVEPSKCMATGTGIAGGTACSSPSFTVVTKDADGREVPNGGAQIKVKVSPGQGVGGSDQDGLVKDIGDGTYIVTYAVPKRGSYMVKVECNGKPIMSSPFPVFFSAGMESDVLANFPQKKSNRPNATAPALSINNETERGVEQQPQKEKRTFQKNFMEFKKLTPPIFEGKMDSLLAEKWIEEMEMMFDVLECDNKEKLFFAVYQLKGNARDWWKAEKLTHELDAPLTWSKFKELFYENYFPISARQQKEIEFVKLEQGSMGVSEYRAKFLELAKFAGNWIGDEAGKTRRFEMGLHPRIRQFTVPFQLNTFSALVEKSLLIERELNSTRLVEGEQVRKRSFPTSSQRSFSSRNRGRTRW